MTLPPLDAGVDGDNVDAPVDASDDDAIALTSAAVSPLLCASCERSLRGVESSDVRVRVDLVRDLRDDVSLGSDDDDDDADVVVDVDDDNDVDANAGFLGSLRLPLRGLCLQTCKCSK